LPQPLPIQPISIPFIELQSVDSTNNYARQQIHAGLAQNGMIIFTHEQTAGKGQRGKAWASEKGVNIALSIIIKPYPLQLSQQFHLNACVAVAVHDFFKEYAGDETKIKWPNDLYWQDRKAGGILIENIITGNGNWDWSIIGIGININQTSFSPHLPNPVSLEQITGRSFKLVTLAKELSGCFIKYYQQLTTSNFITIHELYNRLLYKKNEKVKFKKENRVFEATVKEVSIAGKLVVLHAIEEEFDFGEVEWVI
jgi:BirA family biotin operon repressor/biotin-[acetyl-CoA-carboxylase] ligase